MEAESPQQRPVTAPGWPIRGGDAQGHRPTTDQAQRNDLLEKLGFFYVHQMQDDRKARALAATVTDPEVAYTLRLHAIAYDTSLSSQQKIAEYQKLLSQYPQQKLLTNALITGVQSDLAKR